MQIIFHVWLADSMEGPTPVSALIHAATLVTAGIYVMVRLSIFDNTLVLLVGSLTAIMGGIFGLFQNDLKRVIAFSTCSQLGYIHLGNIIKNLYKNIFIWYCGKYQPVIDSNVKLNFSSTGNNNSDNPTGVRRRPRRSLVRRRSVLARRSHD